MVNGVVSVDPQKGRQGVRLPPYTLPERKLRCRECDARGKAVVSIKWAFET